MGDHADDYMRRQMREAADAAMRLSQPKHLGGSKAKRKRLSHSYPASQHAIDEVGGVIRYRRNRIINDLVMAANDGKVGLDLNRITVKVARGEYTEAERAELYRLIGYSVSGFEDVFPDG
jgi:hypothetical protein